MAWPRTRAFVMPNHSPGLISIERVAHTDEGRIVVLRFVAPGSLEPEIVSLTNDAGQQWQRAHGESEKP